MDVNNLFMVSPSRKGRRQPQRMPDARRAQWQGQIVAARDLALFALQYLLRFLEEHRSFEHDDGLAPDYQPAVTQFDFHKPGTLR